MQIVLNKAIEDDQRNKFLDEVNTAYAALRTGPEVWKEELAERAAWDKTHMDGFETNERI
jgi:hypothetical protein